jgi:hypothetical protein
MLYEIPSVRVSSISTRSTAIFGANGCAFTIYLDGVRATPAGSSSTRRSPDFPVDDEIPATHVTAIEIYPRAVRAPAQFQLLNGTCGIVAFWTKS